MIRNAITGPPCLGRVDPVNGPDESREGSVVGFCFTAESVAGFCLTAESLVGFCLAGERGGMLPH